MLGIIIGTHGSLSNGLKDAAEVIMGTTNNIATVNLNHGEDIQKLGIKLSDSIKKVNQGDGIIILVDLISASPYNQSLLMVNGLEKSIQETIYVIGGVNLPMLLETINHQLLETPIEKVAEMITAQGAESIATWHISKITDSINDQDDDF